MSIPPLSARFTAALFATATLGLLACGNSAGTGATGGAGGAAPASLCQAAEAVATAQTAKLSCASDGSFQARCDASFTGHPQCAAIINAFLQCGIDAPDTQWECDGAGATNLKASACPTQQSAVTACTK